MDKLIIKTAKITDAKAIAWVRNLTWLDTYPSKKYNITKKMLVDMDLGGPKYVQKLCRRIRNTGKTFHMWIVKNPKGVIAYGTVQRRPGKNYLGSLYVLPEYQSRGIGSQLMQKALKWFGKNATISLSAAPYNKKTIKFYKKFGFQIIGPNCDCLVSPPAAPCPA